MQRNLSMDWTKQDASSFVRQARRSLAKAKKQQPRENDFICGVDILRLLGLLNHEDKALIGLFGQV